MSAALETQAAQAVHAARLLEFAVHSRGTWTMRWGVRRTRVTRVAGDDGVVFYAAFPSVGEWAETLPPTLALELDGVVVAVRPCTHLVPERGPFNVAWTVMSRHQAVQAA